MKKINPIRKTLLAASLLVCISSQTLAATADWNPVSSERLVKLPGNYVDKAVEQDFLSSNLAANLISVTGSISGQQKSLGELREAIATAQGENLVDLRHQYLEQKSAFLDLKDQQHDIRGQELDTKLEVYRDLLDRLQRDEARKTDPQLQSLAAQQQAALERMQRTIDDVDATLDAILPSGEQSEYATKYASNISHIGELKNAIRQHVANSAPSVDGREVGREEYVRQLIFSIESEKALLKQEGEMIFLMARLVSLDAQAMEQELSIADLQSNQDKIASMPLGNAVEFFTN